MALDEIPESGMAENRNRENLSDAEDTRQTGCYTKKSLGFLTVGHGSNKIGSDLKEELVLPVPRQGPSGGGVLTCLHLW